LRSQAALTTIDRNDLLFTDEETQELLHHVFGLEIPPEQLLEFRERTQGWIMALQLIRQVAQRHSLTFANAGAQSTALPDLSGILRQSEHDLFDYFAEEVFAYEPEPVRNLLARISLLERIEMETCGKLYPEEGCSVILPSLARRNVFTTIVGDSRGEEYRFHPLFQSFLRRRLRSEIAQAGVAAERVRIGDYFLGEG